MEEFDFSSLKRYEVVGDLMFNNQRVLLFYLCTEEGAMHIVALKYFEEENRFETFTKEEAKEFITMISGDFNTIT